MTARVLIIGGYGNFGSWIAGALAPDPHIHLVIAGRSQAKAETFARSLDAANPAESRALDMNGDLGAALGSIRPDIVLHTTGPFQHQDHRVARACIVQGCHYVDLADARAFVAGIGELDAAAREAAVLIVSGASTVPCLTAAIIDHFLPEFGRLDAVDYGISAAQQTNRGLATTAAVLSYVGKPFTTLRHGGMAIVYGWQDTHRVTYPELGNRLFGNCDIPDLSLFPGRYPRLRDQRFGAGHELGILHWGSWVLSWLVRIGVVRSLDPYSPRLLKLARRFDRLGSGRSGFHMHLAGTDADGTAKIVRFFIVARSGHGPFIPCVPAILLARKLARGEVAARGAMPCLDLIGLEEYLAAIRHLDIKVHVEGSDAALPATSA